MCNPVIHPETWLNKRACVFSPSANTIKKNLIDIILSEIKTVFTSRSQEQRRPVIYRVNINNPSAISNLIKCLYRIFPVHMKPGHYFC